MSECRQPFSAVSTCIRWTKWLLQMCHDDSNIKHCHEYHHHHQLWTWQLYAAEHHCNILHKQNMLHTVSITETLMWTINQHSSAIKVQFLKISVTFKPMTLKMSSCDVDMFISNCDQFHAFWKEVRKCLLNVLNVVSFCAQMHQMQIILVKFWQAVYKMPC